ncbi:hypothetical protein BTZ20_5037 [Rhodococcus sp. MTM3W5.2]|nr:hypothetical protein BTZ20_5037 [Rhodococcus sp. MTM3W5.2]
MRHGRSPGSAGMAAGYAFPDACASSGWGGPRVADVPAHSGEYRAGFAPDFPNTATTVAG